MLAQSPLAFARCTDNLTGTPPTTSVGLSLTSGAGANGDGTAGALLSALAHDVHLLVIGISNGASNTLATNALLDILKDPAGGTSWASMIDDLVCGFAATATQGTISLSQYFFFPLFIPAGTSLGAQVRCSNGSNNKRVAVWAYGEPNRPDMWWCGQGVESLGINAASSTGTTITPGASGAAGTYTNVGGTTSHRYGAVQFAIQGPDSNATAKGGYWNIGTGSARLPGSPTVFTSMSTSESMARGGMCMPIFCDIPAGTQLQLAGTLDGAAEDYNGAIYGVY